MIVVKIEMWPGGDERRAHEIGRALVANVSDLADTSDYVAHVTTKGVEKLGIPPQDARVKIIRHDRRQSVTALLAKVFSLVRT